MESFLSARAAGNSSLRSSKKAKPLARLKEKSAAVDATGNQHVANNADNPLLLTARQVGCGLK